jgi:protein-S-isoprenylcysteine O-methyltransferase Ste14
MEFSAELIYRIVFGALWLVYFAVRLYFQRQVKGMGDYTRFNEKQERLFFRLFALAYLLLAFYFLTPWVDFARFPCPDWLRWSGAVISIAGICFFGWTHQVLGNNWTAVLAISQKHQLVTDGPYRFVRHPMYSAFYLIGFGFLLLSANWLMGLIYLGTLTIMYLARVEKEEAMMLEHFGEPYQAYLQTTGRLMPRFKK